MRKSNGRKRPPALAEHPREALRPECRQNAPRLKLTAGSGNGRNERHPNPGPGRDLGIRDPAPLVDEPDRPLAEARDKPRRPRKVQMARSDHANRLPRDPETPHRQRRVVGPRGAATHEHRVVPRPLGMDEAPRSPSGDPPAFARRRGDPPVEGACELQGQHRPLLPDLEEEAAMHLPRPPGQNAGRHLDARLPQPRMSTACDPRVQVVQGRHDPRDAGRDERVGAGRRRAVMGAGLEAHIGRRPARRLPGHLEREAFGMGPPARCGGPPADNAPVPDDDTTDRGVRPDMAEPARPQ